MIFVYPYRVRYGDSDPMSRSFYARYMYWLEEARTELFRFLDYPYKKLEERGYYLPVLESYLRYKSPCYYDDLVYIETIVSKIKFHIIEFRYRVHKGGTDVICSGWTKHALINQESSPVSIQKTVLIDVPVRKDFSEDFHKKTVTFS